MWDKVHLITESDQDAGEPQADASAWLVSLLIHMVFLIVFSLVTMPAASPVRSIVLEYDLQPEPKLLQIAAEQFQADTIPRQKLGAKSLYDSHAALSVAPEFGPVTDIPTPDAQLSEAGEIEYRSVDVPITGLHLSSDRPVKGTAGFGVTGAEGAVDRITQEILLSLERRKTLVVWLFDESASLLRQRDEIAQRFDRIYNELGAIEASGNTRFTKHDDTPLLTAVVAFGERVSFPIAKPTNDVEQIKRAVANIPRDDSGIERVFTAIQYSVNRFKKLRAPAQDGLPERNVMFVVFTDEAGDDVELVDKTVNLCRKLAIPVYVVGVPAPFGCRETLVKWVDPDPKYDQTPGWGEVSQGPESCALECVRLGFSPSGKDETPLDSGFGPYALTRLAQETGGIYFSVHPNRTIGRRLSKQETQPFSAYIGAFFDTQIMRKYRPDYLAADEYFRRVRSNRARSALVEAAKHSWVGPMAVPNTHFVFRDEASLAKELTEAQKIAASLGPELNELYEILKTGEADRPREATPRWQAGFDLAMGRVLAVKARTESYNLMLAKAKRGMKFDNPRNNTWILKPTNDLSAAGSQMEQIAQKATMYLERVKNEHPQTPWALLAGRELSVPLGWKWTETYTDLDPPPNRPQVAVNSPIQRPRDEQPRVLPKPLERRPVPRL
jgi:hypothetical protein